jgi:hypothetical protein
MRNTGVVRTYGRYYLMWANMARGGAGDLPDILERPPTAAPHRRHSLLPCDRDFNRFEQLLGFQVVATQVGARRMKMQPEDPQHVALANTPARQHDVRSSLRCIWVSCWQPGEGMTLYSNHRPQP